jgi:predicted chitinase
MRASDFLVETATDPLGDLINQKGLAQPSPPSAPSEIDAAKLDQIMQRFADASKKEEPLPAPAVQADPTASVPQASASKFKNKGGQAASPKATKPVKSAPKPYVPVTNSPFEISLRKAAIGAKIVGAELAAFLGQCAVESAKFTTTKEFADGSQYEGRKDLGNIKPGDGVRYKGRGFIQITGRANYTQAAKDLGIDLVNHPELAEKPDVASKVSLWYWKTRVQPKITNFTNTKAVTKKVNGGTNALAQRTHLTKSFQVANK